MADFFESQANSQNLGLLGGALKGFAQGMIQAEDYTDRKEDRKLKRLEFESKMKADSEKKDKERLEKKFDQAGKLRDDWLKNQTTKNSQTVKEAYDKVSAASPNAAGDMGLVFGYMKLLDPDSTVRDSEYANASNTTGAAGKIAQLYNKVRDGQILTPEQRANFKREAAKIYQAQQISQAALDEQFRGLSQTYEINPEEVVLKIFDNPRTGEKEVVPVNARTGQPLAAEQNMQKPGLLNNKPGGLVPKKSQEERDRARLEELRRKAAGG